LDQYRIRARSFSKKEENKKESDTKNMQKLTKVLRKIKIKCTHFFQIRIHFGSWFLLCIFVANVVQVVIAVGPSTMMALATFEDHNLFGGTIDQFQKQRIPRGIVGSVEGTRSVKAVNLIEFQGFLQSKKESHE
jgi:hypothetical protein